MHKLQTYLKVWSLTIPTHCGMSVSSSGSSYTKRKTCYNIINDTCNTHYIKVSHVGIFFAVGYTVGWAWCEIQSLSPPLSHTPLTLWCWLDHDRTFQLWVVCHKHGRPAFHLHERRAAGAEMHKRISVRSRNSVVSQWSIYEWTERCKNDWTSIKHEEGAGPVTEGKVQAWLVSRPKVIYSRDMMDQVNWKARGLCWKWCTHKIYTFVVIKC